MEPYTSPSGKHRHRCFHCAHIWEHENTLDVKHDDNHDCPNCGTCNWGQGLYMGPDTPFQKPALM